MTVIIRVLGSASSDWEPDTPTWLKAGDVEAFDGRGDATLTSNVDEALRFESPVAALMFWRSQSETRPLRDDGQPNRPLTAFTVEIGPPEET